MLAASWQASGAGCEGDAGQHLRFSISSDGGATWFVVTEKHVSGALVLDHKL